MKNKILNGFLITGALCILLLSSCKKKIDDAYLNPNAQTVEPIETLLAGITGAFVANAGATGVSGGIAGDAISIGRYIQYWGDFNGQSATATTNLRYDAMGGLDITNTGLATVWNGFYFAQGQNLNRVIQWGTEQGKWDYVGVAYAVRAWGWLELTNEYADGIVVKQAWEDGRLQFDYDSQAVAYDYCRDAARKAIEFLNTTGPNVSQANLAIGDAYFYNGDVNKWKKFAYGVLARSYAYLSNKLIYTANHYYDSVIKYCDLAMTTNADNATLKYSGNLAIGGTLNYFGPQRGNVGAVRQTDYITKLMTGQNATAFNGVFDPRTWYLLRQNLSAQFKGILPWLGNAGPGFTSGTSDANMPPNLWGNTLAPQSTAAPANDSARYMFRNTAEFPVMTAAEMQFLKAEAAFRKGDGATALTAYSNAISLNIDMITTNYNANVPALYVITPASKAAFLAQVVPATPAGLNLTKIMLQKYIALFGFGVHETWVDMRRFHYIDIDPLTTFQVYAGFTPPPYPQYLYAANNGKLVYRVKPQNQESNYDVPALTAVGAYALDYHTKECWFSKP